MKKHLSFLTNPYFLPLIPALIIFFLLPVNMNKYVVETVSSRTLIPENYYWYEDLTNDGYSEIIKVRNSGNITMVEICNNKGIVYNQWNLHGNVDFLFQRQLYISGDYNQDSVKELYIFTLSNDSVFLSIIDELESPDLLVENRFITKTGLGRISPDPSIVFAEMDDLDKDGVNELIFGITSGFSLYPRNVFAYYIEKDSLVVSPESGFNIRDIVQEDITGDGNKEIILSGVSTANIRPGEKNYHDYSNWLMVLDNNLEFVFDPFEIPGTTIYFKTYVFKDKGEPLLVGVNHNHRGGGPTEILFFDDNGNIVKKHDFDNRISSSVHYTDYKGHDFLALSTMENGVYMFDSDINLINHFPDLYFSHAFLIDDINIDGHEELINVDLRNNKINVFRNSFYNYASEDFNLPISNPSRFLLSLNKKANEYSEISLQVDSYHFLFKYRGNPYYYYNHFLFWPIYFSILGFVFLNRKIFDKQLKRKQNIEKKLSELQLRLFKNLIDPHFSMNVINSVIISLKNNKKEEATRNLQRFARLYQAVFFAVDNIQHKLRDEISVVKEYLKFEKSRFNDSLFYEVNIDANINSEQKIPKILILAYVYYSINSELIHIKDNIKIDINISKNNDDLEIIINDNIIKKPEYNQVLNYNNRPNILDSLNNYIFYYNILYKEKFSVRISHNHDNKMISGSKVTIVKPEMP